jgi:ribosomal protein L36
MVVVLKRIKLGHVHHAVKAIDKNCGALKRHGIIYLILKLWILCDDKISEQPLQLLYKIEDRVGLLKGGNKMINSVSSNNAGYRAFVKTMQVAKAEPENDVNSVVKSQSLPDKQWTPEEMQNAGPLPMGREVPKPDTNDGVPGRTNPPNIGVEYTSGGTGGDAPGKAIPPNMGVEVPGPGTSDDIPRNAVPPQIGRRIQAPVEYQSILNIRG